ncbi:hypothetical protein O3P69_017093 [Scylla paramamosain]|uniref:Uncharacterized protein n=1 Tax=Scylla paramamosain TaxID=85552 RepID=A0AAW0TV81_SCYPA
MSTDSIQRQTLGIVVGLYKWPNEADSFVWNRGGAARGSHSQLSSSLGEGRIQQRHQYKWSSSLIWSVWFARMTSMRIRKCLAYCRVGTRLVLNA